MESVYDAALLSSSGHNTEASHRYKNVLNSERYYDIHISKRYIKSAKV